ncbi:MAG: iron-containing alcohol dehydrogenase [Pseudomonadales bacterium]
MPIAVRRLLHWLAMKTIGLLVNLQARASYMVFAGSGSATHLGAHIAASGVNKLLVVTDKPLVELGVVETAICGVKDAELDFAIFDEVLPDPTFDVVNQGLAAFKQHGCDSVLAIGGGSSIDAAKIIATLATNDIELSKLVGFGKVDAELPPLYAIPTTSGTGSEATLGAVITNSETHEKLVIGDTKMQPLAAALDPALMLGLPTHITAATGMDALTHGIEAYIGTWDRGDAKEVGRKAVKTVFANLRKACSDGGDAKVRQSMAIASFYAGVAINQVNVGSVHAIAHQLGANYAIPHGLANAMVLPHVLEFSLPKAAPALARLAAEIDVAVTGNSEQDNARLFIAAVRQLSSEVGIPTTSDSIKQADIPALTQAALAESFSYPVPLLMSSGDCEGILQSLMRQS